MTFIEHKKLYYVKDDGGCKSGTLNDREKSFFFHLILSKHLKCYIIFHNFIDKSLIGPISLYH